MDFFWTSVVTVIGGISTYVAGEIIKRFFFEPLQEYKRTIGDISYALVFYANIYSDGEASLINEEKGYEVAEKLRKLASRLRAKNNQINLYFFLKMIRSIPSRADSQKATDQLIYISNALGRSRTDLGEARKKIEELLHIQKSG